MRVIDFTRRPLSGGYFAVRFSATWLVYHESNPRQAVWETRELSEAVAWAKERTVSP